MSKQILRQVELLKFLQVRRTSKEIYKKLGYKSSTLGEDIKRLKNAGWQIDDASKGYYELLTDMDNPNQYQAHFMKYQSMAIAYKRAMDLNLDKMQHILFEPNAIEFKFSIFDDIFNAIVAMKKIHFRHLNFKTNIVKEYELEPYALKEYQNRWYVIGTTEKGYRTFSLDRISNLRILEEKNAANNIAEVVEQLESVVGVSFNEENIEQVLIKLQVDNSQKEYLRTIPIHKSQKILEENEHSFVLHLFVGNTVELRQQILKYGNRIEVLEPKDLRKQIFEEVAGLYKKYSSEKNKNIS